ncbi:hypothetical protein BYT27DRAFT_7245059 [Phlegmacium glaucopus]|nr:hypothetical protein BYT27DRAFT_7245059 [Phlegmacium glaucopus]
MLNIPSLALVYFFAQVNVLAVPVPFYRGVSFQPPAPSLTYEATPVLDTRGWLSHITKVAGALAGHAPGPMSSPIPVQSHYSKVAPLIAPGMDQVFPDQGK